MDPPPTSEPYPSVCFALFTPWVGMYLTPFQAIKEVTKFALRNSSLGNSASKDLA